MNISENKDIKINQKLLLEILVAFDKVCVDNNIEYFLAGGTCLGAIRHGGFLPWDDDIDMYMKASEWEAKKDIIMANLPDKYDLSYNDTDPLYNNPIIRISDKDTTQFSRSRATNDSAKGVMIEIFLLDPMPDGEEESKEYYENFWLYSELSSPSMAVSLGNVNVSDEMVEKYHQLTKRIGVEGRETVVKELEEKLFNFKEEDCSTYHLRWGIYWVQFPISAFREAVRVKFEDRQFPVAIDFPYVLFGEYGDNWMIIPEPDNQATHDTVENLDVSYTVYEEAYKDKLDKGAFRKAQEKNKDFKLDRFFAHRQMNKFKAEHKEALALACLDKPNGRDLYMKIQRELFDDFYLINVGDEYLADVFRECLVAGDTRFIAKAQKLYKGDSAEIAEILQDLQMIRDVRFSYYLGKGNDYIDTAVELATKYPGQVNLIEFICQVQTLQGQIDDGLENLVRQAIQANGQRPRLMKIAADIEMTHGRVEAAREIYMQILETSRDGMVNQEIRKILEKEFL